MLKNILKYFTKAEWMLWILSISLVSLFFLISPEKDYFSLSSSFIGITALIFAAKGNPFGQVLMIIFCIMYGIISYFCAYYGEVLTYVFMTGPMAVYALISWLKNPYENNRAEVKVEQIKKNDIRSMLLLSLIITVIFYYVLRAFGTANLYVSTISITTSFIAVYLTAKRSPFYAIAYAANDVVLIILWTVATLKEPSYASTLGCFCVFLANDIYGFISWRRMEKRQQRK